MSRFFIQRCGSTTRGVSVKFAFRQGSYLASSRFSEPEFPINAFRPSCISTEGDEVHIECSNQRAGWRRLQESTTLGRLGAGDILADVFKEKSLMFLLIRRSRRGL